MVNELCGAGLYLAIHTNFVVQDNRAIASYPHAVRSLELVL